MLYVCRRAWYFANQFFVLFLAMLVQEAFKWVLGQALEQKVQNARFAADVRTLSLHFLFPIVFLFLPLFSRLEPLNEMTYVWVFAASCVSSASRADDILQWCRQMAQIRQKGKSMIRIASSPRLTSHICLLVVTYVSCGQSITRFLLFLTHTRWKVFSRRLHPLPASISHNHRKRTHFLPL